MIGVWRHQWWDYEQFGIALRTEVKKVRAFTCKKETKI